MFGLSHALDDTPVPDFTGSVGHPVTHLVR
jgi:hypothetical protein